MWERLSVSSRVVRGYTAIQRCTLLPQRSQGATNTKKSVKGDRMRVQKSLPSEGYKALPNKCSNAVSRTNAIAKEMERLDLVIMRKEVWNARKWELRTTTTRLSEEYFRGWIATDKAGKKEGARRVRCAGPGGSLKKNGMARQSFTSRTSIDAS
jgi:hypothetical protein